MVRTLLNQKTPKVEPEVLWLIKSKTNVILSILKNLQLI